jgi:hypothetical protein
VAATAEKVAISREIAGVGRLDFEQNANRRAYLLLPEGKERRATYPSVTEIIRACWPAGESLLNWQGSIGNKKAKEVRDESAAIGTDTHRFIETYLSTGSPLTFDQFPENRRPFLVGAAKFLGQYQPEPIHEGMERLICHPELKYAGRLDFLGILNDSPALTLLDYKTSAGGNFYAKAHAQLAGYALADKRCGGETIERYGVVGINGQGDMQIVWTPVDQAQDCWLQIITYYTAMRALLTALGTDR